MSQIDQKKNINNFKNISNYRTIIVKIDNVKVTYKDLKRIDYIEKIDEETKLLLKKVYNEFGQYTAWKLRDMTHHEKPWIDTIRNNVIDRAVIQNYFKEKYSNI